MEKRGINSILLLVTIISLIASAYAADVTRDIDPTEVEVGGTVTVSLYVDVDNADAYAIDERYPSGWTVLNAGSASTTHAGHLKWVVVGEQGHDYDCTGVDSCSSSIADTTYTYTLRAPTTAATGTFSGQYMFDIDSTEHNILGTTSVDAIVNTPNECSVYDDDQVACQNAPEDCAWCPLNNDCEPFADIDCTEEECVSNSRCTSACTLSECDNGCEDNACLAADEEDEDDDDTSSSSGTTTTTTTCTPNWDCGEWSPAQCPEDTKEQSRTCTDLNKCQSDKLDTKRCRLSATTTGTTADSSSTTTTSRTRTTATDDSSSTSGRTRSTTTKPEPEPTSDELIEDNAENADMLFYVLLIILVGLGGGLYFYFKNKSINYNVGPVDLHKQQEFVQNQQQGQNRGIRPL